MGLHLCYELDVPRDTSIDQVVDRVQRLYHEAITLPFEKVGPLVRVTAATQAEPMPSSRRVALQ